MNTAKRKINVGLLPEQTEDYSQYEESELNWARIIMAAAIVLIMLFSIYAILKNDDETESEINTVENTPTESAVTMPAEDQPPTVALNKPEAIATHSTATSKQTNIAPKKTKTTHPVPTVKPLASASVKKAKPHTKQTKTPIKILDSRIKKAQLSSNLIKGLPVDTLSSQVSMSDEGIIRVHLYTEMENLRGQNLYHHWYRNGHKQAKVRVPINHNHQRSSSSKFINKHMLGQWTVQVLDDQGKAYIEVNFEVI